MKNASILIGYEKKDIFCVFGEASHRLAVEKSPFDLTWSGNSWQLVAAVSTSISRECMVTKLSMVVHGIEFHDSPRASIGEKNNHPFDSMKQDWLVC